MNQRELAKICNVNEATISKILNSFRRPSWELAKRLSEVTGSTPEIWMEGPAAEKVALMKAAEGDE